MTTFTIVNGASAGTSGLTTAQINQIREGVRGATTLIEPHIPDVSVDMRILLEFQDLGNSLATGGTSFTFAGNEGPGQEMWELASLGELVSGRESTGSADATDLTLTINTRNVRDGTFFFDPNPAARTAAIPREQVDFLTVATHELLHGFGFLTIVEGEPGNVDESGPDVTPFDDNIDLIDGVRFFNGANAVAANGGQPVRLEPGLSPHIADAASGGFTSIMNSVTNSGERRSISDVEIAMLQDLLVSSGLETSPPAVPPAEGGTAGADRLVGTAASETFDGLAGTDTVVFSTARAATTVDVNGNGTVTTTGPGGTDTLVSIERLEFSDGALVFDLGGDLLDYVYRVYSAAFARTPDEGGLRYWNEQANTGTLSQEAIATFFAESDEFALRFGANSTNEQFIDALYNNALLREPDAEGFTFWTNVFATGERGRDDMLVLFAESAENVSRNVENLDDGVFVL